MHDLVLRKFYRKVAYHKQKQAYVFTENNVLVPLESSNYVIFHEPAKLFSMNQPNDVLDMTTKQCKSVKLDEMSVIGQQDI